MWRYIGVVHLARNRLIQDMDSNTNKLEFIVVEIGGEEFMFSEEDDHPVQNVPTVYNARWFSDEEGSDSDTDTTVSLYR